MIELFTKRTILKIVKNFIKYRNDIPKSEYEEKAVRLYYEIKDYSDSLKGKSKSQFVQEFSRELMSSVLPNAGVEVSYIYLEDLFESVYRLLIGNYNNVLRYKGLEGYTLLSILKGDLSFINRITNVDPSKLQKETLIELLRSMKDVERIFGEIISRTYSYRSTPFLLLTQKPLDEWKYFSFNKWLEYKKDTANKSYYHNDIIDPLIEEFDFNSSGFWYYILKYLHNVNHVYVIVNDENELQGYNIPKYNGVLPSIDIAKSKIPQIHNLFKRIYQQLVSYTDKDLLKLADNMDPEIVFKLRKPELPPGKIIFVKNSNDLESAVWEIINSREFYKNHVYTYLKGRLRRQNMPITEENIKKELHNILNGNHTYYRFFKKLKNELGIEYVELTKYSHSLYYATQDLLANKYKVINEVYRVYTPTCQEIVALAYCINPEFYKELQFPDNLNPKRPNYVIYRTYL